MLKIKYFVQQSWLLIVSSFCFGLLIAATSAALSPRIERNRTAKLYGRAGVLLNEFNAAFGTQLPQAQYFEQLDVEIEIESIQGKKEKVKIIKAVSKDGECVGWSFSATGPGWAEKIELVVAADKDFKRLAGFDCLVSNETPGFGARIKLPYYRDQFVGAPAEELKLVRIGDVEKIDSEIVAITRATVSSEAVVDIINNSVAQIRSQMQKKRLIYSDK